MSHIDRLVGGELVGAEEASQRSQVPHIQPIMLAQLSRLHSCIHDMSFLLIRQIVKVGMAVRSGILAGTIPRESVPVMSSPQSCSRTEYDCRTDASTASSSMSLCDVSLTRYPPTASPTPAAILLSMNTKCREPVSCRKREKDCNLAARPRSSAAAP